jgi:hypothetical protein
MTNLNGSNGMPTGKKETIKISSKVFVPRSAVHISNELPVYFC